MCYLKEETNRFDETLYLELKKKVIAILKKDKDFETMIKNPLICPEETR